MAPPTPHQQARRERLESMIGLAAPFLDLMLAVGDRVSRAVSPGDDYIPIRPPSEAFELESRPPAAPAAEPERALDD